jgi:hypothetical protein
MIPTQNRPYYLICNYSAELSQTYCNRFTKPYFQPDFPNKTTLVVTISTQNKPYYLILILYDLYCLYYCFFEKMK